MILILDASVALAWQFARIEPSEALLARRAIEETQRDGAVVPALWYAEIINSLLVAERRNLCSPQESSRYLADLATLPISVDSVRLDSTRSQTISLGRTLQLSGYDATYLELALRTGSALATFDRKLADAARTAGIPLFGDPPPAP